MAVVVFSSKYASKANLIKKRVSEILNKHEKEDYLVTVNLVGEKVMKGLASNYLGEKPADPPHNVLSFSDKEVKVSFVNSPDEPKPLGEIYICFPVAQAEARGKNLRVEEWLAELAVHGTLHLLGIHHK